MMERSPRAPVLRSIAFPADQPGAAQRTSRRVGVPRRAGREAHSAPTRCDSSQSLPAGQTRRAHDRSLLPDEFLTPEYIKATDGERSSIDLPEHDVERADDRRDVGKHVPAA
jgi:hypothetical protein